ncbi:regulator of G-protein signaling loco isoform X2 [Cimex lectularius]|uniref:Regulator of G-protein signaling loco n=1 Tax=Cimex lectularius TaxID=79782 RepID=A0A8I6RTJ5_CIMLE|nr:regulator of G-protein signaling loco isoform X2 [Cimex lectularius]
MHPVRRRKKRPNYGVRTVEVKRGQNGFGFTISGQHPCILSCIVAGSPAENAGLRAGDYLVAVEGQSVSKVPHDDVVRLIGCSNGVLKLQIAENYYSDSSDDDILVAARQKPKYPHKYRLNGRNDATLHNRLGKVVRDLRSGGAYEEHLSLPYPFSPPRSKKHIPDEWKLGNHIPPPVSRFRIPNSADLEAPNQVEQHVFRAVVGYVGTIEMPRKLPPGSRLQIVRGCIKKLRAEKRPHTPVLMTVMTHSLRLTNGAGITLAVYPGDRVTFCGASSDKDRKHFGVVTTATGEDPSSSCHIFAVDARPHSNHFKRAKIFKLECKVDPGSGICTEFPVTCDPIIAVIKGFYETSASVEEPVVANSPQPSNDSTTTTSNSDSGIGFRDDCGNQSDRILVVDVQNHRLHIQEVDKGGNCADKVTVHTLPNVTATSSRSRSPLSTGSEGPERPGFLEDMSVSSETTKSPEVTIIQKSKQNSRMEASAQSVDDMSISSARSHDAISGLPYKLNHKMYSISPPTSQSLEDLKETTMDNTISRSLHPHSGSLQDLRSFNLDCFERSVVAHTLHGGRDEGVSCWATSFEKLLEDPAGLHTFAEFLKKEFSHENIYFWVACEKYRKLADPLERKQKAKEIFNRHLALGALEPVNVDSYARQVTEELLSDASPNLFLQAQKQIFNLMKFDSYPRFIKSDLYKECVVRVLAGEELPVSTENSDLQLSIAQSHPKLKKSRSDADDRRRKSLLPWTRKARAKSRDRGNSYEQDNSSVSSSRSSLTTWDVPLSTGLCRVVLPDGSTAVVHTRPNHTVRHLITRLLDKRALCYSDFHIINSYLNKTVPLDEDASVLSGQEVKIERRVSFRLDLPNRKTVAVKSKQCKTLSQVLRPILNKYGYKLEMVTLCLMSENEVLEPSLSVTHVDSQRIQVLTRSTPTECLSQIGSWRLDDCNKGKSLDEITNRVFEELLNGKAEANVVPSEQGSVRSEDWGSESSSGILGRFLRRDSAFIDKRKPKKGHHKGEENERKSTLSKLPPLIAKLKPSSKVECRSESDVLYEGLKRAQRSRLEDQRGTEINFELPDFLKDKENSPQGGKKLCKLRGGDGEESNAKLLPNESNGNCDNENTNKTFPAEYHFTETSLEDLVHLQNHQPQLTDPPPPLPPKPKNLSGATSWTCLNEPKPRARTRRTVYLDQPSSSFV